MTQSIFDKADKAAEGQRTSGYIQRFSSNHVLTLMENMEKTGEPIYRPSNILEVTHPLNRLIRMMYVDQRITKPYFDAMHKIYCVAINLPQQKINANRGNTQKALEKPDITWRTFEKLHAIIGAVIVDLIVELQLNAATCVTYRYNDLAPFEHMAPAKQGTPIFKPEQVAATIHPIGRFIRMYAVDQQLTMEEFSIRHHNYYADLGYPINWITSSRNNSIERYFRQAPMFAAWEMFLAVMGVALNNFTTVVRHKDNTVVNYSLRDAVKFSDMPDPWG